MTPEGGKRPATEEVRLRLAEIWRGSSAALEAFEVALARTEATSLYAMLHACRRTHEQHVTQLAAALAMLGGPPPAGDSVQHSFLDYTQLRLRLGEEASLRGLCAVVRAAASAYDACLAAPLPADLRDCLAQQGEQVRHQLAALEEALAALA